MYKHLYPSNTDAIVSASSNEHTKKDISLCMNSPLTLLHNVRDQCCRAIIFSSIASFGDIVIIVNFSHFIIFNIFELFDILTLSVQRARDLWAIGLVFLSIGPTDGKVLIKGTFRPSKEYTIRDSLLEREGNILIENSVLM